MKVIAFTGAGISKQSHIPTFVERPDVRENYLGIMLIHIMKNIMKSLNNSKANMNGAKPK